MTLGAVALALGCDERTPEFDFDGDGWDDEQDCGPDNGLIHPGADDVWGDGVDQNCDGSDGTDLDGDGYPHDAPPDTVVWDCDDVDPAIGPHADEECDGVDNNCDGALLDAERDDDGDGYIECGPLETLDCDDEDRDTYPGAEELCDGLDNDCDGEPGGDEFDADTDGYAGCDGDCDDLDDTLSPLDDDEDGYSSCDGDCDDHDPALNPGDADGDGYSTCDGDCDDDDATVTPADDDGDGYSSCGGDCADDNVHIHPAAEEVCGDGDDNDCDGARDDEDGDCAEPPAYLMLTMTLEATGAEQGGSVVVNIDVPLLDEQYATICTENLQVTGQYTFGEAGRQDYHDNTDELLTWSKWAWSASSCPPGWDLYRSDLMIEWIWTVHPTTFVSCNQATFDATLADTFLGDDPHGQGDGTFGGFCDVTGPYIEGDLGLGSVEAVWMIPGYEGQIDHHGTYGYFPPDDTTHVPVWMIGGLLFADANNPNEPCDGLDGGYDLVSFWAIDNVCMNGSDDDSDGWIDLDDPGCRNIFQPDEAAGDETACSNGVDDDGDGDVDSADAGCVDGWDEDEG